jgi:uncharacterized protein
MLRSEHSIVSYENGKAIPDRLTRKQHAHYLHYAQRMLAVYRSGVGQPRRELHQSIQNILAHEADCDPRRVSSFCKLLDDTSEFDSDRKGAAAALRLKVFALAAKYHPLVQAGQHVFEREEFEAKRLIAQELAEPWEQINARLYIDVMSQQPMKSFEGYADPQALLSRYNVAQLQACLYRAQKMTIHARADFKVILRYAKLARLLHDIRRLAPGEYRLDFSGPATVLHETRRYGVNFARFIPALLACRDWRLQATLQSPWGRPLSVLLGSEDGYSAPLPAPAEFDSSIEQRFAEDFGAEREGWRLQRESAILHEGQSTFVPDFTFRHTDGREIDLEIVGFWTAQYLEDKRKTLQKFRSRQILVAVAQRSLRPGADVHKGFIVYKTRLKVDDVLAALQSVAL